MSPATKKEAGKQRKSKSTEPSDKPKKPMTAYFRFTNEKRAEVKAKNPEMKVTEISKVIGQMWKDLKDEEKAVYQDAYNKEMKEYKEKYEEWKEAHPEEEKKEKKAKKEKKEKKAARKAKKAAKKQESEEEESEEEEESPAPESESEEEESAAESESD